MQAELNMRCRAGRRRRRYGMCDVSRTSASDTRLDISPANCRNNAGCLQPLTWDSAHVDEGCNGSQQRCIVIELSDCLLCKQYNAKQQQMLCGRRHTATTAQSQCLQHKCGAAINAPAS